jgi:hypothetical protein
MGPRDVDNVSWAFFVLFVSLVVPCHHCRVGRVHSIPVDIRISGGTIVAQKCV